MPRWAQDKIAELRRRVEAAEAVADAARLATDPEGADAVLSPHHNPIGLGSGRRVLVAFRVPFEGRRDGEVSIRLADDRNGIYVQGDSAIVVQPHVSNCVTIRPAQ